ncbi:MAG: HAD hydrolase-like protein [Cytophagaceae bacterium]|nr:HAD hydrolase-like protein [Cytophagaceae bacterium]
MASIQLITFDMAGTTVRDAHEVDDCFAQAAAATGLSVTNERILALQGYSKIEVFRLLWSEKLGDEHPELGENVAVSYDAFTHILENHYQTSPVYPTEGALETFTWLRQQGIKIALTTGFYRKVTDIILNRLGWLEGLDAQYLNASGRSLIDASIASDEVAAGRPEPLMIHRAMKLLSVTDSYRVINIGDTPSDLKSGVRAGCRLSLGVTNGTHTRQQLAIYRNDGLLRNVGEIREVISRLNQKAEAGKLKVEN